MAQVIASDLSGIVCRSNRPRRRYQQVLDVDVGGRMAAWVGYDSGNELVYVEGKGETTPDLVECLRARWPSHTCPRLDVCEDYRAPGAFEALQGVVRAAALASARGAAPRLGYTAFPDDPVAGRTWGNLVRGGVGYVRMYEPGKMAERVHWGPDAVRVELEARPHSADEKRAAARMTPLEVWGLTGWTHRVAEALTGIEVPRFAPPATVYTQARTTQYLARTFRRHWQDMLEDFGSWECIGRELAEVWRLDDELARVMRNQD